ncbi:MAG: transposase [Burkholderiaceae bacterium]|nr:transposase [Burkholderiaceae bacterium]
MARLPRLSLAGVAHLVLLRGHNGEAVFRDSEDRQAFLDALEDASAREQVALHAYALPADRVWLLCTPAEDRGLSRAMQAVGRRFASAFNRRYRRSGSVWDGRYRSTVVEPGRTLLDTMVFVDRLPIDPVTAGGEGTTPSPWSSARQHVGFGGPISLKDTAEYWALGNTPFERTAAYRALLSEAPSESQAERIAAAAHKGWALGSTGFVESLQSRTARPLRPRRRGRPRQLSSD